MPLFFNETGYPKWVSPIDCSRIGLPIAPDAGAIRHTAEYPPGARIVVVPHQNVRGSVQPGRTLGISATS